MPFSACPQSIPHGLGQAANARFLRLFLNETAPVPVSLLQFTGNCVRPATTEWSADLCFIVTGSGGGGSFGGTGRPSVPGEAPGARSAPPRVAGASGSWHSLGTVCLSVLFELIELKRRLGKPGRFFSVLGTSLDAGPRAK